MQRTKQERTEPHKFLIPDYYPRFACKMGACRSACCVGWPISISMKNYFYLLGLDCRRDLRERLDRGLRVLDRPTEEEYARFEPRYDGNCALRMQDGRCALHAGLGEDVLPDVCRLYPRGIHQSEDGAECSCANSCEAVLELLLAEEQPITFSRRMLTLQPPPPQPRIVVFDTLGRETDIRLHLIKEIQDRSIPLPQRLLGLGDLTERISLALQRHDAAMLDRILQEPSVAASPAPASEQIDPKQLAFGLGIARSMIEILDARSQSIRACGEAALAYFGDGDGALERYRTARSHFETLFPHWERFYENLLVNHMFFSQFPFQDRPEDLSSEYIALCAVYAILRFLGLGCMAERQETDALIDGLAATFRLIDHTDFDRYALHLLKKLDCTSRQKLADLVSL